ncbi:MAG TPA: SUMF1/EgtB/PvdO family nonheme iron enzyme [Hyphomicrobium sp.]|nr:SUMF1/EgtB/PvdO family nonheme iron enzyme [Hyphomicrobium sp.]
MRTSEYLACVAAKACEPPEWLEPGGPENIYTGKGVTYKSIADYIKGDDQPIVGVSWDDANAYATWLSKKTGHHYRLPSETEWEYAARAGSKKSYWWGSDVKPNGQVMACCRGCGSQHDGVGAYPVGSFKPNAFGLYDVHGNG